MLNGMSVVGTVPSATDAPRLRMSRREAQSQLTNQIKIGRAIKAQRIRDRWELDHARAEKQEWVRRASDALEAVFAGVAVVEKFNEWTAPILPEYAELEMFIELFGEEMRHRLSAMQEACDLSNHASEPGPIGSGVPETTPRPAAPEREGRESPGCGCILLYSGEASGVDTVGTVERFLSQLELKPTRVNRADGSPTILEQLESSGAALAIFVEPNDSSMFDLGCCIGRLGCRRVYVLNPVGNELGNLPGVTCLSIDNTEAWHLRLARQLRTDGIAIDLNRML